jgi:large subunit ribosomal protein L18
VINKQERHSRRKKGIRKRISGTAVKPRITVYKSNRHLYVQAIDDYAGNTVGASSDYDIGKKPTMKSATKIGGKLAEKLLKKKIKEAVFDRNGYPYLGLVKEVAEGIRKGGIKI